MKHIVFYFYLFLNKGIFTKDLRIIGGSDADVVEFSYSVSFRDGLTSPITPKHFCGGAIISNQHILTAGHCLYAYQDKCHVVKIYPAITLIDRNEGRILKIDNIIFHPEFDLYVVSLVLRSCDICVVKVTSKIIFTPYINKIDLPNRNISVGDVGVVSGWGTTSYPKENFPEQLQKTIMTVHDGLNCLWEQSMYPNHGQFCVFNNHGVGTCFGDSGGPFVVNHTLAGIVSFTIPCAQGVPDIFISVHYYLDFITEAMTS